MNRTLRVTWNHPYIRGGGANDFLETQRLISEPLEAICTAQEVRERASIQWYTPLLVCSHRTPSLGLKFFVHVSSHDWPSDRSRTESKIFNKWNSPNYIVEWLFRYDNINAEKTNMKMLWLTYIDFITPINLSYLSIQVMNWWKNDYIWRWW